jgi:benzodiazapine receptor
MASLVARYREFPRERPILALAISVLTVEIVGASGAIFTAQGLGAWYDTLQLPTLAPPNWVFGPVWTTLFALIGVALWLIWRQASIEPDNVRLAVVVFVVNFVSSIWVKIC